MRCLVLLALACAALAARSSWPEGSLSRETAPFRPGFQYRFHFDGQIASGLPMPSSQAALTRVQARVAVSFPSESHALMQIEDIRVGSQQKDIVEPKMIQPFELVDHITLHQEHARMLRLPMRFRYERGMVSDIEFDSDDQTWSENIKRAVINMFQVNIGKEGVQTDEYESKKQMTEGDFFTTNEKTIEGDCEVTYTMVEDKKHHQKNSFRLTKSINFDKCTERVSERINFRFGDECPSCEKKWTGEERSIESSSLFNFELVGTPEKFLLKQVEARAHYIYAPANQEKALFKTLVSSKLTLEKVEKEDMKMPAPKADKKQSLLFNNEWSAQREQFTMNGDEKIFGDWPYTLMKNRADVAAKLLKQMVNEMSDEKNGVQIVTPHLMARLVRVLRGASKDEMMKIHREVCENKQHEEHTVDHIKEILNDALALAGTKVTVEHLIEKMRTRQMSQTRSALLLQTLSNMRTPSMEMVKQLLSLAKELKKQPALRQSALLSAGSLFRGVCGDHRDLLSSQKSEKKMCSRQIKETFVQEMLALFEQADTRYEKVLALKALANAAIDISVFPLEKIIKDRKEEKSVRLEAMDALRQLRSVMPRKMQSLLMPLYKQSQEQPEIRVAAFHHIMHTLPERNVLDQIASQLEKEPSQQVAAFVHSALSAYAKSEIPCEKRMADDIQSSLQLARVQPRKVLDSRFGRFPIYSKEYMAGASLNWAALFSNDSVLPKEIMASLETAFAGQWQKYLAQVGVSQQNVDQVLSQLLQQIDEKGLEQVLVRGKRSSSLFQPAEMLKELFRKLSIKGRQIASKEQQPHVSLYIRFRDQDYAFLPIDEQVLPDILKQVLRNGRIELGELEQILAKGYRFSATFSSFIYEHSHKIVTPLGLPVIVDSKMPTVASVKGSVHFELLPKNGKNIDGLRLRVKAQPSIASTHVTKMTVWSPIVTQGVKLLHSIQMNTPVDMTIEANWEKNLETKMTIRAPETENRVAQLQSRPVTFVTVWPKEARTYVEPKEKTVYVEELEQQVKNMETEYMCKTTGLKVKVEGHVHGHFYQNGEQTMPALLFGENNVEISMQPTPQTPQEYVLTAEVAALRDEKVEQPEHFRSFYEKSEEHFETERDEQNSEDETERRTSFHKYLKQYAAGKAIAYTLKMKAATKGAPQEKHAKIELRTVCDEKLRFCKMEADAERSPLGEERKQWTATARVHSLYPEMPATLNELKEQKHREYHATVQAEWGAEEKNTLNLKIQGEQNKQQKQWLARLQQQKKQSDNQELSALEEYSQLVEAAMLNQYKAIIKYEMESTATRGRIEKAFSLIKSYSLFNTDIQPVKNEEGRVQMQLSFEPETRQYANLTIETPREKVSVQEIRLPFPLRLVNIRRQHSPVNSFHQLGENIVKERAQCRVQSNKVNTFDDVIYRTPMTPCYSVLAKDCSDSEQPDFAVLMKKVQKKGEEKKIKIVTRKNVIEIEMSPKQEKLIIKVNGEKKSEETLEEYGIYQQSEQLVTVRLPQLTVDFDGYMAEIKMSEMYKSQQCGVCGHYDGEKKNELRRADNKETDDIEEFQRSYLSKDEECEMDEETLSEKKNYEILSSESSSEEEKESLFEERPVWQKNNSGRRQQKNKSYDERDNEIIEPIEKTRVTEFSQRVCFSKQPVPECPRKTYQQDEQTKQIKVKFACVSRQSAEASRLIREARREILSIEDLAESFAETLTVPKACLAY